MALVDGIWEYDEGDVASPTFSELLNLLGDSVRDRIAALEADLTDDTGWVAVTPAAGFTGSTIAPPRVRIRRGEVLFKGVISGSLPSSTAVTIGSVAAPYRPGDIADTVDAVGLGNGATARGAVSSSGAIQVIAPSAVSTGVYLKGLGGYIPGGD